MRSGARILLPVMAMIVATGAALMGRAAAATPAPTAAAAKSESARPKPGSPAAAVTSAPAKPVTSAAQLAALTRDTAKSLANARVVRGEFVQQRRLAGLSKPLQSDGDFLFARDLGIEWHTRQPFDSQFVLTHDRITQRDEGGETLQISAADQPALTVVSRVFFALFALDFQSLSQDFAMSGIDTKGADWQLQLTPKTAALGSVFKRADLEGDATVKRVVLQDANGDSTTIELRAVRYDAAGLTADERRRF
ncbi:MAG TPA: outer membrane lipoprotein carrier protein LolA [Steroidobacteraceae bacterium]|nr:outer membrane lipoprotein carrier protein LolA [Steroidobacteraceae bacterium]